MSLCQGNEFDSKRQLVVSVPQIVKNLARVRIRAFSFILTTYRGVRLAIMPLRVSIPRPQLFCARTVRVPEKRAVSECPSNRPAGATRLSRTHRVDGGIVLQGGRTYSTVRGRPPRLPKNQGTHSTRRTAKNERGRRGSAGDIAATEGQRAWISRPSPGHRTERLTWQCALAVP